MVERRTIAALIMVQLLFGLWPVTGKLILGHLEPLVLATVRTVAAAAILLALLPLFDAKVPWKSWPQLAWFSLLGIVLNQGLFIVGLQKTTAINATLLVTTIPIFTYLVAVAAGKETLGPRRLVGILLALAGVLYLLGLSNFEGGRDNLLGDVLVVLNSLSYALFLVYSKPFAERHDPFAFTTGLFVMGSLMFLPIGLWLGMGAVAVLPSNMVAVLSFIIIGPTVGAYVLNNTALRRVPASTVAIFIYLQPVIAAITAWWLLGEQLTWRIIPAAVLILAGVTTVSLLNAKKRIVQPST